ncbi:hypothetical protein LOD99_834 [Oopsacas minuta]|uniref:Transposase n=1 Tax=Oopsacas minuta TaxID=111878 RepID=A0AAV7JZK6_9METZ|nr:hypothetical protein LOD99_834 [Oopsacas minuta]
MKAQEKNRIRIKDFFDAGMTKATEISRRLTIPERTIYRVLKSISDKKSLTHKKGAGRPQILHKSDRNRIMALVQHNPRITLNECRAKLSTPIAKSTLLEEMKRRGLQYRQVVRIPALSQLHITKRIEWCKRMRSQNWSKVFFTDECSIWMNSGKIYVWTKKGQPINLPTFKHPAKLHIWGGISVMGKTNLKVFTENFNQERYKTVLNECLIQEANALYGNQWVLQEDNSPIHTGNAAKAWKQEFVPHQIDWPSNSPDLNPIENLWAVLKKRLLKKRFNSSNELKEAILEIWNTLDPEFLKPFCLSMDKRIRLCIKGGGKKINY